MTDTLDGESQARLSLATILPFSVVSLPLSAIGIAVFVYLPPYFASHLGVSMVTVGAVWGTVRLIDIPVDVILALMMDRTRTRIGRYRPWLIGGAPILMAALYFLFMAPRGVGAGYLVGGLLAMYLGASIVGLAHAAWSATLATRYHERSRLFGVNTAVGVAGALGVLMIPILGRQFGLGDVQGVQGMGWAIIALIPLTVGLAAIRTPERATRNVRGPGFALRDYWEVVTKPDLLRLFLAQMALTLGPGWMSALYLFFFKDARGFTTGEASGLLAIYILAGVPGAMGTAALARRIGKHRALMVTTTLFSLGLFSIFILPKGNFALTAPAMLWTGALASGFGLMISAMIADVGDEVRLSQGKERISLLYAVNALAGKLAAAGAIFITYPLLQALGYKAVEGSVNTPDAINNLTLAFIVGPIVFVMLGGACVIGWRLDARRQGEVRAALDARDAAAALAGE